MTGFGDAVCDADGVRFTLELRSLNNRYFKASVRLPDELTALEADIESRLRKRVYRGSVVVTVGYRCDESFASTQINAAVLNRYLQELGVVQGMADQAHGASVTVELGALLNLPGVIEPPDQTQLLGQARSVVAGLLDEAVKKLQAMRATEGKGLVEDLRGHLRVIAEALDEVVERAPSVVEEYHQRLRARIAQLAARAELEIADQDLVREVAIFAERCDISEEAQRLRAHLEQFEVHLSKETGDPVGRTLDFIAQEMLREANTIGSKSNDAAIGQTVVRIKGSIDRIKEQVQNIE